MKLTNLEVALTAVIGILVIACRYLHLQQVRGYKQALRQAWDAFTNEQQRHMESRNHLSGELGKAAKLKESDERMILRLLKENEAAGDKLAKLIKLNAELVALASKLDPNGHGVTVTSVAGGGCSISLLPANKHAFASLLLLVDKLKNTR